MLGSIESFVSDFVLRHPLNRLPGGGSGTMFDAPLVGCAAADDELFDQYKQIIGFFHLTPRELVAAQQESWQPRAVISWILPSTEAVRTANAQEATFPAYLWSHMRSRGEDINMELRRALADFLREQGGQALVPQLSPAWQKFEDTPVGIASSWSERHAAYAAGLGTFSISDGLISARGIAHRCGSVVTSLEVEVTPRPYSFHGEYCLYMRNGTCLACAGRCPVHAIGPAGHEKDICNGYVYGTTQQALEGRYDLPQIGCGLCQTGVPCSGRIP